MDLLFLCCLVSDANRKSTEWVLQRVIGKFGAAQGIAVCPKGNIAATDYGGTRLKLYCRKGNLVHLVKFSNEHQSTSPYAVAISSDGTYFVTDQTNCVTIIHGTTYEKHTFPVTIPDESNDLMLEGLALDNQGNLLIGCPVIHVSDKSGYILTYTQDGIRLSCVKVALQPKYLAMTWQNTIVVSSLYPQMVQIVDRSGDMLHTLHAPATVSKWWPRGICCTEGRIYVANAATKPDTGIYCYSLSGQYLDCITTDVAHPMGLAVTDNNKTLLVAERDEGVKVFTSHDVTCDDVFVSTENVHCTHNTGSSSALQASLVTHHSDYLYSSAPESPLNLALSDDEEHGWKTRDSTSFGGLSQHSESGTSTSTSLTSDGSSLVRSDSASSASNSQTSDGQSLQSESTSSADASLASNESLHHGSAVSNNSDDLGWLDLL